MASDKTALLDLAQTLTNKTLTSPVVTTPTITSPVINTGVSGTAILDEDDMATDSNTQLATQQSIKAFVTSGSVTMTNKRLTSPKINEDVSVSATATEINTACDGITATATEINTACDGITATASEINTVCDANTATAAEIIKAADGIGVTIPRQKIIEIGDWDMDATEFVQVAHGLSSGTIVGVRALIRSDAGATAVPVPGNTIGITNLACRIDYVSTSVVQLVRETGGTYDSTAYNSTSYNRGWIIIDYID